MARDKDRWIVSEAVRLSDVWKISENWGKSITLLTDCDEQLEIIYGNTGQIRFAQYLHWNRDTGEVVCSEEIKLRKRKRVLELLQADKWECTYCRYYATHHVTGEYNGLPVFKGTKAQVIRHADEHPIGDPRDMAARTVS